MATDLTALTATFKALVSWTSSKGTEMGPPTSSHTKEAKESLTFGSGAGQINQIWFDRRILSAGGTDSLDLAGVLTNYAGATVTFATVKGILIHNRSDETLTAAADGVDHTANAAFLDVRGEGTNGLPLFKDLSDIVTLEEGDWLAVWSKDGVTVTAATGDLLNIVETQTLEAAYDIVLLGVSA